MRADVDIPVAVFPLFVHRRQPYSVDADRSVKIDQVIRIPKCSADGRHLGAQLHHYQTVHPFGRHNAARCVAGDQLYAFGGNVFEQAAVVGLVAVIFKGIIKVGVGSEASVTHTGAGLGDKHADGTVKCRGTAARDADITGPLIKLYATVTASALDGKLDEGRSPVRCGRRAVNCSESVLHKLKRGGAELRHHPACLNAVIACSVFYDGIALFFRRRFGLGTGRCIRRGRVAARNGKRQNKCRSKGSGGASDNIPNLHFTSQNGLPPPYIGRSAAHYLFEHFIIAYGVVEAAFEGDMRDRH